MNRTGRTANAELLQAQRYRAEHLALERRQEELAQQMRQLETHIGERREVLTDVSSQTARELIAREITRLEAQIAEANGQYTDVLTQMSDLRTRVDNVEGRVGTLESRTTCLRGDVDGLQAHSEAHASAISHLQAANGWVPPAAAAVAGLITYVVIELFRPETATHIQWAWTLVVASVVGLIASLLTGEGHISARTSSSASAGAGTTPTPQPLAPLPDVVIPSPPPSGSQPTVQAAAAAAAVAQSN